MIEWLLLLLLVAAILILARGRVLAIPAMLKLSKVANADLTGAQMRYGPHWRRAHQKVIAFVDGAVLFLIATFLLPALLPWPYGGLLAIALIVYSVFVAIIIRSFGDWYDDLLWGSRTLKLDDIDPLPWDGTHTVWSRSVGEKSAQDKAEEAEILGESLPDPETQVRTVEYIIARETHPDGWWSSDRSPHDAYFAVFPLRSGSDEVARGVGGGVWNGHQYDVTGRISNYILGGGPSRHFIEFLSDRARRFVDGCDLDLRSAIYKHWPDAKWYSGVLFVEEPDGDIRRKEEQPPPVTMLDLMDLRSQIARFRRDSDKTEFAYSKKISRMSRR